jgi:hypothetical protein
VIVFQKYPVVPLYGDMQISLESTIKRATHYDEKTWGAAVADTKLSIEYEILNHLESVRVVHNDYLAKFGNMINEVDFFKL